MTEQITVFGANGKVGRQVVDELLMRGYRVVAFVHSEYSFDQSPQLKVVQGDVYNFTDVSNALTGSSGVISALGSWGTVGKDILTVGMAHIINAMTHHNIARVVSLTGAEARALGDHLSIVHRLMHLFLTIVSRKVLVDGERHIAMLEESQLDWTVIRSPIMSSRTFNGSALSRMTAHRPMPWAIVSRSLVVAAIVDTLHDRTWKRKAPFIA